MKVDTMFPHKYATGQDLNGRAVTLEISHVKAEKMRANPGSPEESKFVIYFEGAQKGVVLSRTLAKQIAEALGEQDTDNWHGKRVVIYPENLTVAGVARVAIRARAVTNEQTQPEGQGNGQTQGGQ